MSCSDLFRLRFCCVVLHSHAWLMCTAGPSCEFQRCMHAFSSRSQSLAHSTLSKTFDSNETSYQSCIAYTVKPMAISTANNSAEINQVSQQTRKNNYPNHFVIYTLCISRCHLTPKFRSSFILCSSACAYITRFVRDSFECLFANLHGFSMVFGLDANFIGNLNENLLALEKLADRMIVFASNGPGSPHSTNRLRRPQSVYDSIRLGWQLPAKLLKLVSYYVVTWACSLGTMLHCQDHFHQII